MRQAHKIPFGVTLIELVVVIGIIAIISVLVLGYLKNTREERALAVTGDAAISFLREARSKTLASEEDAQYGVHFESGKIVLFRGLSYTEGDPFNIVNNLSSEIVISEINLGGTDNVIFSRLIGTASASGTVVISVNGNPLKNRVVNISGSGVFNIQ